MDFPTSLRNIGQPLRRKEDERLMTGRGRFTDDFSLPDQAFAAMVRSPHPHAKINGIDAGAARAMPGVLGVFTGADALADGLGEIPHNPVPSTRFDMKLTGPGGTPVHVGEHFLLPADRARHVGEAVAMVVAETRSQAYSAAEAVTVDFEPLDWVAGTREAAAPDAPRLWDQLPDNILVDASFGDVAATTAAFAAAANVVTMTAVVGRVTGVPLEPRAALGWYDPETQRYTLYAGSGGAVRQKHELAKVIGVEPAAVRVVSLDVGGNFGTRNRAYVEFGLVMWASRKLGRPVKFRADRSESFLTDYQGRDLISEVSLALDKDGHFLALRASNLSNVGARCVSLSPLSKGSGLITGSYHIPVVTLRSRATFSNTMPTQAYRSSGRPEVTFAIERLIDKAARELGFDRLDLRRRNLVQSSQMPYRNAVGSLYDSGEYRKNMDRVLELGDWAGAAARRRQAQARGKLFGQGFANYVESSIGSPKERADIIVHRDGGIEVVIGTQPAGQGHETSFAQVMADLLGVDADEVTITLGDTDVVSAGGGTHSGRSMRHASTVMALAAQDLIEKAKGLAAEILNTGTDQVTFGDGLFSAPGTNRKLGWQELAAADHSPEGLRVRRDNEMHQPVFPNGACMCEIEIDPDTGGIELCRYATVDDVGRCINPMIVHGQTHGGIAQGVGQALWESFTIDPDSGQPVAGSLTDYGMPRFDNLPSFTCEIAEVHSPTNPFGVKAGGEGGTTPAPAVIMSAIENALEPLGAIEIEMPATPLKIWNAIRTLRARTAATAQGARLNDDGVDDGQRRSRLP
jgi:carbon-monoxide dehydrogenase large subunit